jgi:glycosyltransferase involved in cell wall biosynthesis
MKHQSPPLLVFADDWGRHPSSCQHLVGHLLNRYEVWWVNSIGMRRPRLDAATLSRGIEKIRHWLRPAQGHGHGEGSQSVHPRLHILSPWMWPSFGSAPERRINRNLLARQLIPTIGAMPESPIALTNIPIVADLVGLLPVRRWVYYCVDDFAEWPGLDGTTIRALDDRLIERADVLIAVSPTLQEKLGRQRQVVHLLTHGVDLEHWDRGDSCAPHSSMSSVDRLEHPLIVFWGVIDRRMDVSFLERLSNDLTSGTIVLVGPESDPDPRLARLARVVRHPAMPFEQLPKVAHAAQVLIMPYADLPVTQAMQPLKLKEYLATGKPVVVRELPSTLPWRDTLDITGTPEAFSRMVRERLAAGLPEEQRLARGRLANESWAAKALTFERWLLGDDGTSPHDPEHSHLIEVSR